jgi:uncharacterized protein (DUF433 family)
MQEGTAVTKAVVAEHNLVDVPLYTPLDVARYLRAPVWLILAMWRGRIPPHPEMLFYWLEGRPVRFERDEDLADIPELRDRWPFRQLADLYVRLFAVESLLERARSERKEGGRAEALAEAAWRLLRDNLPVPVFFGPAPPEEGISRMLQSCRNQLAEEEGRWLEKRLLLCLGRIDMEGGAPSRLYPFSRVPAEGSPRTVVMDPRIRFGRPTLAGHGTPTDILLERHQAGDSIADLADDYGLLAAEVEEAIRYEAIPLSILFPFFGW